jgi:carbon-monoxide dehydrogenase small subunit
VRVDGELVCACLLLAAACAGREIETVEGLAGPDRALSDVQEAFHREGAVQCGFCTPGLIMAVHDLLDHSPDPDDLEIREAISGNLCRCTGYGRIFAAVRATQAARHDG